MILLNQHSYDQVWHNVIQKLCWMYVQPNMEFLWDSRECVARSGSPQLRITAGTHNYTYCNKTITNRTVSSTVWTIDALPYYFHPRYL